jgi:hypothetical protein
MRSGKKESVSKLAALRHDSPAQAAYALTLLDAKNGLEAVRAALDVLAKHPQEAARPKLRALYEHYAAHNGTRDVGAYTRSAILKALRSVARPADTDILLAAVTTYEFPPPAFAEEAGLLRGVALVILNEVDEQLARYFATRLLADGYAERMSGEPALTAAKALASQEEWLPIYFYAVQNADGGQPEVTAECLRQLTAAPLPVVHELIKQFGAGENLPALVGLFDLLLQHRSGPQGIDYLIDFLKTTRDMDLYRYLCMVMATSPEASVRAALAAAGRFEQARAKLEILRDALVLAPPDPALAELSDHLASSRGGRRG